MFSLQISALGTVATKLLNCKVQRMKLIPDIHPLAALEVLKGFFGPKRTFFQCMPFSWNSGGAVTKVS